MEQLTEEVAKDVAASPQEWMRFLNTASRLYKYTFPEQLLIYAQRPEATAVASMEIWNQKMYRWIKKGSKGIALIDNTSGPKTKLRYVFDVQDTYKVRNLGKDPQLWNLPMEGEQLVADYLQERLTLEDTEGGLAESLHQAAKISHFIAHGSKRIGMLAGELPNVSGTSHDFRLEDFKRCMKDRGLYDDKRVFIGAYDPDSGYAAIRQALNSVSRNDFPDALLISNDAMAIGALKAFKEAEIGVPKDVSIISFNDTISAQYANPPLSSIRIESSEMGRRAVDLLIDRLDSPDRIPYMIMLGTKLILRESSVN